MDMAMHQETNVKKKKYFRTDAEWRNTVKEVDELIKREGISEFAACQRVGIGQSQVRRARYKIDNGESMRKSSKSNKVNTGTGFVKYSTASDEIKVCRPDGTSIIVHTESALRVVLTCVAAA